MHRRTGPASWPTAWPQPIAGIRVLHRPRKLGLGSAYEDAFRIGLAGGSNLFVEMDADGSHLPGNLDAIVSAARSVGGLAIGSRYIRGGEVVGWPFHRYLLSWAANVYCRLLLWLPTHDCTSGYRCYTRDLLHHIKLDEVVSQGYSFQIEMVYRARQLGYRVVETPIRFEDRVAGASKVSQGEVRRALLTVLAFEREAMDAKPVERAGYSRALVAAATGEFRC